VTKAKDRKIVFNTNTDMLAGIGSPPKIFHSGITGGQLAELSGCVRKSNPSEFWHNEDSLDRWIGQQVQFVLKQDGKELERVTRVIESIEEKQVEAVTEADLQGTLAGLVVRECGMPFLQWFRDVHHGGKMAMVIRVRKP
jgi:hypothetical protein